MNITGNSFVPFDFVHVEEVIRLDREYFYRPWNTGQWVDLDWNLHFLALWGTPDKLKGFGLFSIVPGDEAAHLLKLLVRPELQGSGEAKQFFDQTCGVLKDKGIGRIFLEVEKSNTRAIKFYEKAGFKLLRLIKNFYSDGGDALTMDVVL